MRAVATRCLRSSSSVARRTRRETRARASTDPRATTTTTAAATAFARVMSANEETVDPSAMDATQSCQGACSRETPRLSATAIAQALRTRPLWRLTPEGTAISRRFTSKNWATAMAFLNQVSDVAEREGHHPDVSVKNYRDVEIVVGTHAIGGLSRFDFILAAKIDAECVATYSPKWARENGVA
jgi:4a-hydroxytetrahydrobiopterin dehydratase